MMAVASQPTTVSKVNFRRVTTDIFNLLAVEDDFTISSDDSSEAEAQSPTKRQRIDDPAAAANADPEIDAPKGYYMSAESIFYAQLLPHLRDELRRLENNKLNVNNIAIEVCHVCFS